MLQKTRTITSCASLVKAIKEAYRPSIFECPNYALFKLTQNDYVSNYYATFTTLANHVKGVSFMALLPYFISGLKNTMGCHSLEIRVT